MPQTQLKPARNQSIECARLLASIFVIFIHCPFPGKTGQVMDQLARFAVPMFFALSGYFSYRISQETVLNRGKKIFWLDLGATVLYGLWGCFLEKMDGGSAVAFWREAWEEISFPGWFFSNDCPFAIHLWYLNAMLICYLLFWGYLRCFRGRRVTYRPLYILGAAALAVNIALDIVAVWEPAWLSDNVTRNAFFFGLPMFAMGIFLREHGDKIRCRLRAPGLVLTILAGIALTLLQWRMGIPAELPVGAVVEAAGMVLLFSQIPAIGAEGSRIQRWISKFGSLSTTIYILHVLVMDLYDRYRLDQALMRWGDRALFLRPATVVVLSLVMAILLECLRAAVKVLCTSALYEKRK